MRPIQVIENPNHPDLQGSPLICYNDQRLIIVDPIRFYALPEFDQRFWLAHEEGHIELNTNNEFKADEYAFNKLVNTEYQSLKKMVSAVKRLLNWGHPEHEARIKKLIELAYQWDANN